MATTIRVGTSEQFCIDAVVESTAAPDWVFGRLHLWIGGNRLGHELGGTALNGCRNWIRSLAEDEVDRRFPEFMDLAAGDILANVRQACFVDGGPEPLLRAYKACDLTNIGMDALDDYEILLLESRDGRDRIVWKRSGSTDAHDVLLPRNLARRVAAGFVERFDAALRGR